MSTQEVSAHAMMTRHCTGLDHTHTSLQPPVRSPLPHMTRLEAEIAAQARRERKRKRKERERRKKMVWGKGRGKRVEDERGRFVNLERAVVDVEEEGDDDAVGRQLKEEQADADRVLEEELQAPARQLLEDLHVDTWRGMEKMYD